MTLKEITEKTRVNLPIPMAIALLGLILGGAGWTMALADDVADQGELIELLTDNQRALTTVQSELKGISRSLGAIVERQDANINANRDALIQLLLKQGQEADRAAADRRQ